MGNIDISRGSELMVRAAKLLQEHVFQSGSATHTPNMSFLKVVSRFPLLVPRGDVDHGSCKLRQLFVGIELFSERCLERLRPFLITEQP